MPRWLKFSIVTGAVALGAMPAAFVATFLLYPFWSWIEAQYQIEWVGHSGPADWCFLTVYGVFLIFALLFVWRGWRRGAG